MAKTKKLGLYFDFKEYCMFSMFTAGPVKVEFMIIGFVKLGNDLNTRVVRARLTYS